MSGLNIPAAGAYRGGMWSTLSGVFGVVLVDLVLSGDNALLIGMACAGLPPHHRRRGILYGSLAAIVLRILMATGAAYLLTIPFLRTLGGLLLLWIAYRLTGTGGDEHGEVTRGTSLWDAVRTIIMADVVMSLDNVLAVGGISGGNLPLLLFGLGLTIPIIMWGSGLVAALLNRAPWLTYAGAAVLAWTAGHMVTADPLLSLPEGPAFPVMATALVLGFAAFGQLGQQGRA